MAISRSSDRPNNRLLWSLVTLLGTVVLIVLILLIIVLVWYENNKFPFAPVGPTTNATSPITTSTTVLTTPPPVDSVIQSILSQSMNLSADPKHDIFGYSCGNWQSKLDIVGVQRQKAHREMSELLKNTTYITDYSTQDYRNILQSAYLSCQDHSDPQENLLPLQSFIMSEFGFWPMTKESSPLLRSTYFKNDTKLLWNTAGKLIAQFMLNTLVSITVQNYVLPNSTIVQALQIDQGTLGLPDNDFNPNNPMHDQRILDYKSTIKQAATKIAGENVTLSHALDLQIDALVTAEKEIYRAMQNPKNEAKAYNMSSLQSKYNFIDWESLLLSFKLPNLDTMMFLIPAEQYLNNLRSVVSVNIYKEPLQNYLVWRFVQTQLQFLDLLPVIKDENPSNPACVDFLAGYMSHAINAIYATEHPVNSTNIAIAERVVDRIKFNVLENLSTGSWLKNDQQSYENVRNKIAAIALQFGEQPMSNADLNTVYQPLIGNIKDSTSWFQSKIALIKLRAKQSQSPSSSWVSDTVSPMYLYVTNRLVIPNALLTQPFLDALNHPSWNLGLFGGIVAQQMLKAIDPFGLQYSVSYSNAVSPLPLMQAGSLALREYKTLESCLWQQYSTQCVNYTINSAPKTYYCIDANRTINTNIVDNMAAKSIYMPQSESVPYAVDSPHFKLYLTANQLLVVALAQGYCIRQTSSDIIKNILLSNIPPNYIRMQIINRNSKLFHNAFGDISSQNSRCDLL